jgi:hypothetical protein
LNAAKKIFNLENPKYDINSKILDDRTLKFVGNSKVRAQSGDASGGILSHFVREGIFQETLQEMFITQNPEISAAWLKQWINVGRYKFCEVK